MIAEVIRQVAAVRAGTDAQEWDVRPGDTIRVMVATEVRCQRIEGQTAAVADHGWYSDVRVQAGKGGPIYVLRLYRDGPPTGDGVIACQVLRRRDMRSRQPF